MAMYPGLASVFSLSCVNHALPWQDEDKAILLANLAPDPEYRYGECWKVLRKAKQAHTYFGLNFSLDAGYAMSAWDADEERSNDHAQQTMVTGVAFVD